MNTFKKLATLSMALLFALGLGALTACNGDDSSSTAPNSTNSENSVAASTEDSSVETADSSSEEQKTYTHYEFTVLDAAGNKVADGYQVQLCTADNSNCYAPVATVNGECVYNVIPNNTLGEYVVHVLDASYQQVELKEEVVTSADAFGAYTLQLAE